MLLKLFQHLLNYFHVLFAFTFSIDEDVIKVHYHKNVKLVYQDLVDIALKYGRYVSQSKKHDLVLKVVIASPEDRLPFVTFPDPHLMIGIGLIELSETSSLT